jgi:hypothetical protein
MNCSKRKCPNKDFSNLNSSMSLSHNLCTFCSSLFITPSTVNIFNAVQQHCLYSRTQLYCRLQQNVIFVRQVYLCRYSQHKTTRHTSEINTLSSTVRTRSNKRILKNNATSITKTGFHCWINGNLLLR